ncbi:hypothetical protein ACWGB8_15915 [Kitasatospora sp. NPDC054939]
MPVEPPESQDVPSGFDPGQETPLLRFGVWGDSGVGPGVIGSTGEPAPSGPQGGAGVLGVSVAEGGTGVRGLAARGNGVSGRGGGAHPGVAGAAVDGPGVVGVSEHGTGVSGVGGGAEPGVAGSGTAGPGVAGSSTRAAGVSGVSTTGAGVTGHSVQGAGVGATSQSGSAVAATSGSGAAVRAVSSTGTAVSARSGLLLTPFGVDDLGDPGDVLLGIVIPPATPPPAIEGVGVRGAGVVASSFRTVGVITGGPVGIMATGRPVAGQFNGNVHVTGVLTKGGGGFRIDHPLDPENRFLAHSFVESPERKNVYDGTVTLDGQGRTTVELPDWFEALNADFRYQLTAIGAPAPDLHIAREIGGRSFEIAGGGPGQRVSWQVTGVRADVWAKGNPLETEEEKSPAERGFFLHPGERGEPPERGLAAAPRPEQ